jgi:hypothetical protein
LRSAGVDHVQLAAAASTQHPAAAHRM